MSSMIYPAAEPDVAITAAWLQRSVTDYFGAIDWTPTRVTAVVGATEVATPSLDISVVQYFANFPWAGASGVIVPEVATSVAPTEPPMLDPAAIADWLDFAPTVDPASRHDRVSPDDSGSLADFSDFF